MQEKINQRMEQNGITFGVVATHLGISKQTLTKKVLGTMDWTYPEMMKLTKLLKIEHPQEFFFG